MADTVRERIIQALQQQLGPDCQRFSNTGNFTEPMTAIVDETQTLQGLTMDDESWLMAVVVERSKEVSDELIAAEGSGVARSKVANEALGELQVAFKSIDRYLGGLCKHVEAINGTTVDPGADKNFVGAALQLEIQFSHARHDPYTVT